MWEGIIEQTDEEGQVKSRLWVTGLSPTGAFQEVVWNRPQDGSTGVRKLENSAMNSCPSMTVLQLLVQTETLGRCPLG